MRTRQLVRLLPLFAGPVPRKSRCDEITMLAEVSLKVVEIKHRDRIQVQVENIHGDQRDLWVQSDKLTLDISIHWTKDLGHLLESFETLPIDFRPLVFACIQFQRVPLMMFTDVSRSQSYSIEIGQPNRFVWTVEQIEFG